MRKKLLQKDPHNNEKKVAKVTCKYLEYQLDNNLRNLRKFRQIAKRNRFN